MRLAVFESNCRSAWNLMALVFACYEKFPISRPCEDENARVGERKLMLAMPLNAHQFASHSTKSDIGSSKRLGKVSERSVNQNVAPLNDTASEPAYSSNSKIVDQASQHIEPGRDVRWKLPVLAI